MSNAHESSHRATSDHSSFGEKVEDVSETAQQFISSAQSAVKDLGDRLDLSGRLQRNPYGTLAAALGVGYVLGGGLFTSMTGRLLRLGVRLAALPLVKDELLGMAEQAFDNFTRKPKKSSSKLA